MLRKAVLVVLLSFLVGSPVVGQEWARKMFGTTRHDFGSVARDAEAEYAFELSNLYMEDVHIAGVRSSCGCTSPRIAKPWLKTYQKGAIIAAFNTGAFTGHKSATLTVTIDKPHYAQVQLHVSGQIRSDVTLSPGSVQLGSVDQGTPVDRKIAVNYSGYSNWRIAEVKSPNPHITAKAVKTRHGGRAAYELLVHLDEHAPAGYIEDHLVLVTKGPRAAQIPVRVEGRVLPGVSVSPATLFMGVVEPGQKVTKQLVVRGKRPFRILSISCDDESFEFGATADEMAKPLHLVPVSFVAGENPGKVARKIRIVTDLGESQPELSAFAVVSTP